MTLLTLRITIWIVIRSFADDVTAGIFERERSLELPLEIQSRALRKLQMLHAAADLRDLKLPRSNQLERLEGDRAGRWSIRINDQWRVCFRWNAGNADGVEMCDYH